MKYSRGHNSPIMTHFWLKMIPFIMFFIVDLSGYDFKYFIIIYYAN